MNRTCETCASDSATVAIFSDREVTLVVFRCGHHSEAHQLRARVKSMAAASPSAAPFRFASVAEYDALLAKRAP